MRRIALIAVMLTTSIAWGQVDEPSDDRNLTHGQFAAMLMQYGAPNEAAEVAKTAEGVEAASLDFLKRHGLVPVDWVESTVLTHGQFADVLSRIGVVYVPANADKPVSRAFAEAKLRRELGRLHDYMARRMGHGFTVSHAMDAGIDRAVSPDDFQ